MCLCGLFVIYCVKLYGLGLFVLCVVVWRVCDCFCVMCVAAVTVNDMCCLVCLLMFVFSV